MRPLPKSREQERIPEPHARQLQHQRRRDGEKRHEGYVVEISMHDGSCDEVV